MDLNSELDRDAERIFAIYARGKVGVGDETPRFLHNTMVKPSAVTIGAPLIQGSKMIVQTIDKEVHPGIIICSE